MSNEIYRERWLSTLPKQVREALEMSPAQMNDFSDNVRMADYLTRLAFGRVVEALEENKQQVVELGPVKEPEPISSAEVNARLALALKANEASAALKEKRIALIDKYESVNDIPIPANIEFHVVESTPEQQKARLKAIGRYKEEEQECEA